MASAPLGARSGAGCPPERAAGSDAAAESAGPRGEGTTPSGAAAAGCVTPAAGAQRSRGRGWWSAAEASCKGRGRGNEGCIREAVRWKAGAVSNLLQDACRPSRWADSGSADGSGCCGSCTGGPPAGGHDWAAAGDRSGSG